MRYGRCSVGRAASLSAGQSQSASDRIEGPVTIGHHVGIGGHMGDFYEQPKPPRDIPHLMVPELRKRLHWNDPHEWRVNNWIEPWDWQSQFDVGLISVPSSK